MNMTHILKIWPEYFEALLDGRKSFEWRKDDGKRFDVNDNLLLKEWNPAAEAFTGRDLYARISYILRGGNFGVPEGYSVLSLDFRVARAPFPMKD